MIDRLAFYWDGLLIGETLDEVFFDARPHRKYFMREALPDEIEAMAELSGDIVSVAKDKTALIVGMKHGDAILRDYLVLPPNDVKKMLHYAGDEEECRKAFEDLMMLRRARTRRRLYGDYRQEGATLQ